MVPKKTTFANTLSALALSAGVLFGAEAMGQDVSHLPPEKAATVKKLRSQLTDFLEWAR